MEEITKEERIALIRATLSLLKLCADLNGGDLERAMILLAIRLYELEGQPLDIKSVECLTGIPRRTIGRKLEAAQAATKHLRISAKWIGRRRILTMPGIPPDSVRTLNTAKRIFANACQQFVTN